MKNKDIETRFEFQDNQLKFLIENQHDLCKRNHRLEERINKIEKKLEVQEITVQYNYDPHSLFRDKDYVKLEEANEPPFIAIYHEELSKNKCPHCGSHDLFVKVYHGNIPTEWTCQECGKKFSSHEVAHDDKTAFKQIEELKDVNKKLDNEIDELVHKYDTMNRRYLDAYDNYRDVQDKLDDAREANKTIKEDAAKLIKEKEELIKVLNIYQAITDIDYDFLTDTAMVRLNGADGAGRAFIHDGDAARALYSAYNKYHDNSFKYKPGEKPDYKMSKKEKDEWIDRDMFASACYAMESLAKSADALATHLQKRQVYLANPKSLKVPVEFMLEDARYNFPFLREKRVWALDTCRTNVIRIVVMYDKAYCYDFNKQSLTPVDALMED